MRTASLHCPGSNFRRRLRQRARRVAAERLARFARYCGVLTTVDAIARWQRAVEATRARHTTGALASERARDAASDSRAVERVVADALESQRAMRAAQSLSMLSTRSLGIQWPARMSRSGGTPIRRRLW